MKNQHHAGQTNVLDEIIVDNFAGGGMKTDRKRGETYVHSI